MIYFTADTHFCPNSVVGSCGQPFAGVEEMNRALVDNWNSLVTDRDDIYIPGDFMYKGKGRGTNNFLSKLKGRKYLIKGNHEKYLTDPKFKPEAFKWIHNYYVLKHEGVKIVPFHYPLLSWDGSYRGSIHVYGHVHNRRINYPEYEEKLRLLGPKAVNAGVDVNGFYPVSIEMFYAKIKVAQAEITNNT